VSVRDLADGESVEMKGSAKQPYVLQNTGGVYSCSCPAWRNQSRPIDIRTCKHLKKLRGAEAEVARVGTEAARKPVKRSGPKADAPGLLLAHSWEASEDPTGWWMSEKLDGVRAYWDGQRFVSRLGNHFLAPDWFTAGLPLTPLDGELWVGRRRFDETVSIVRRVKAGELWRQVTYLVFDAPTEREPFEARLSALKELLEAESPHARMVEHTRCDGVGHLREELTRVEGLGGEGLMLRQPGSRYEAGRSTTLLKVKSFHDAEGQVVGYVAGRGKHKGKVGSLKVVTREGIEFSVGTGLSDSERADPPPLGAVVTYRYQEVTKKGAPRFPSYVGVRGDATWEAAPVKKPAKQARKKASRKPPAEPAPSTPRAGGELGARYFELVDGKSSKFWEVTLEGVAYTVRYGRIGANGQRKTKEAASEEAAVAAVEKLIAQKTGKGYVETEPPS
jgi:DNA ligase-1